MSGHKLTASVVMARQMRAYKPGERVKILRGRLAGEVLTVTQSGIDWVMLKELPRRDVMSKRNVEPEAGFTEEELIHAKRAAEKMQGSLIEPKWKPLNRREGDHDEKTKTD